jgi:4-hydroxybenzoate polyprenyltransferase
VDHWVKNAFILPGTLAALALDPSVTGRALVVRLVVGLLAIGLVASSNYIINELLDGESDRSHPTKSLRPVPSGQVHVPFAYAQWILLMLAGVGIGFLISLPFGLSLLAFWIVACAYNIPPIRAKDLPYLDVLTEGASNPLRLLAGWYLTGASIAPPASLLVGYWMLGGYFMALKRFAEFRYFAERERLAAYRLSFRSYSARGLLFFCLVCAAVALSALTAFALQYRVELLAAVPLVIVVMAVYLRLAFQPDSPVQHPEALYREPTLTIAVVACAASVATLMLVDVPGVADFLTGSRIDAVRLEAVMAGMAILVAFMVPELGRQTFTPFERAFRRLARRRVLSVVLVGVLALGVRAAMIPWLPVPVPGIDDEFSYLLAGDTYAQGRLANPTHPMWQHLETVHVSQVPTYASMYPPAQGMTLAAGELLGHPWIGVWITMAGLCAAICWMAQGWLPPEWALLGGILAVLRLATFNYWMNSYWGGGVPALAGALVLGALPRLRHRPRVATAIMLALGLAILANSRPYEGLLVSLPVGIALVAWMVGARAPRGRVSAVRVVLPIVALLTVVALAMAYFNWRVFGSALTMPYQINRAQYAVAPHFVWQSLKPAPVYRHAELRDFYLGWELDMYRAIHSVPGFFKTSWARIETVGRFFFASALFVPLVMLPWAIRDRRMRLITASICVMAAGVAGEVWFMPHYVAPAVAAVYVLLLQCLRHLRAWRWRGQPVGRTLVRGIVMVSVLAFAARAAGRAAHVGPTKIRTTWDSADAGNTDRAQVEDRLRRAGGRHLVIVRYGPSHSIHAEWVHNLADIDDSPVVWARDMDEASNQELIAYFKDRKVWMIQPGSGSLVLEAYARK